jgi:hypothetical protein
MNGTRPLFDREGRGTAKHVRSICMKGHESSAKQWLQGKWTRLIGGRAVAADDASQCWSFRDPSRTGARTKRHDAETDTDRR